MAKIIIFTCVALVSIAAGLASTAHDQQNCKYQHPQTLFCQSDFAIKVKIVSKLQSLASNHILQPIQITKYNVRVKKFYLDRSNSIRYTMWQKNVVLHFEQPIVASKSMVTLRTNLTYVIFGNFSQDKTYIKMSNCGFYVPWHQITREQRFGLRHGYRDNCQRCTIKTCSSLLGGKGNKKSCTAEANECVWKPSIMTSQHCQLNSTQVMSTDCHALRSTCAYHESAGQCSWIYHKAIRKCKVEHQDDHKKPLSPYKFGCH